MLHVQHKNWQSLPRPLAALSSIQIMQLVVPKATEIVTKMDLMCMKKEALSTQFPALAAIKKFQNERNSQKYILGFLSLSLSLSVKRWQIVKESFVGGKTEKFRTELPSCLAFGANFSKGSAPLCWQVQKMIAYTEHNFMYSTRSKLRVYSYLVPVTRGTVRV